MPNDMGVSTDATLVTTKMASATAAYCAPLLRLLLESGNMQPATKTKVHEMLALQASWRGGANHPRSKP